METEETLPFPPPLTRSTVAERMVLATVSKRTSGLSLEQLTEARLAQLRNENFLWETPPPHSNQMVLAADKTDKIVRAADKTDKITLASRRTEETSLVPLRWRGVPVSEELQVYALRVARGEDLAPYRGPILADPQLELPWDAKNAHALKIETRRSVRLLLGLAGFGLLAAFALPKAEPSLPESPQPALAVRELALSAAPVAAASEAPPSSEPLPALREPLPALREPLPSLRGPAAALREPLPALRGPSAASGAAASAKPDADTARNGAGSARPASSADGSATRQPIEARQQEAPLATLPRVLPGSEATQPSTLLLDKPSF